MFWADIDCEIGRYKFPSSLSLQIQWGRKLLPDADRKRDDDDVTKMKENVQKCFVDPTTSSASLTTTPSSTKCRSCQSCQDFRFHKYIIYILLAGTFCLHATSIVEKLNSDKVFNGDIVRDASVRQRRSIKGSGRDYSDAKVEFIHPKLREEMDANEQQDPNNPWVWLTSYSRIPVKILFLKMGPSSASF